MHMLKDLSEKFSFKTFLSCLLYLSIPPVIVLVHLKIIIFVDF